MNRRTFKTLTEAEFEYVPFSNTSIDSPITTVASLQSMNDRDIVSLNLFIKKTGYPKVSVVLPYLAEPLDKLEVCANDDSGSIPLTLWGDKILDVPSDGCYTIKNAVVKKLRNNAVTITTNTSTKITHFKETIKPTAVTPAQLRFNLIQLPADNVNVSATTYYCSHCKRYQESKCGNPILFKCLVCSTTSMSCRLSKKVEVKLDVTFNGTIQTVYIPGAQVELYFSRNNKSMPIDADDLAVCFSQDNSTKLIVDQRFSCVGFE